MEKRGPNEGFVYRVSVSDEWEELQRTGATLGGDLDRTTGCIHLSDLDQVKMVLNNFFRGQENLYLLQIDATKETVWFMKLSRIPTFLISMALTGAFSLCL
ncbi:uncharacterized protein LOC141820439 isoform X2 [Curcuma longa]|uniref:uncharacterized protein LOC141820439 isoform X2 n=1 Tax=Curcuma longa TaxID=136217 RepID=UPI003D9F4EFA